MGVLPRFDARFEIHRWEVLEPDAAYVKWLRGLPVLYARDGLFPNARVYPRDEMLAQFGPYFFTSTIALMLALAISKSPEAIGVWGVETGTEIEYRDQRPAHHHFIQIARDRGIEIVTAAHSMLLEPPAFYGDTETI